MSSFADLIKTISSGFLQFTWIDAVDILIICVLIYKLIIWTKATRAYQVLKGIGILFICSVVSQLLQLNTVSWLLDAFLKSGSIIIVLVVLFQPEFRRVLERLGRGGKSLSAALFDEETQDSVELVRSVQASIRSMAKRRIGALIVVEQKTGLDDLIATGTRIDGLLSGGLLENIFEPNTPLHDGAVIVRGDRVVAAGCFLPLSDDMSIAKELGTRHRAALGVSTVSDSVTIVISEETGAISIARDGNLIRHVDTRTLNDTLTQLFIQKANAPFSWIKRRTQQDA